MPTRYDWLCYDCRKDNCQCGDRNYWIEKKMSGKTGDCTFCEKKNVGVVRCVCDLRKCPAGCGHALQQHDQYTDYWKKYQCCEKHEDLNGPRCEQGYWCKTCVHLGLKCEGVTREKIEKIPKKKRFEVEEFATLHEQVLEEDHQLKAAGND